MTATTQLNPEWFDAAAYVEFLNQSFPGQWDGAALRWYAQRSFNDRQCDLIVRADDRQVLAGVTLCYRQVLLGSGPPLEVCVLSAGATRPDLRGRGHYAEMLLGALERCRSKECVAALGFVTRDNGSGRGLLRLGAQVIPTFYLFAEPSVSPRRLGRRLREHTPREPNETIAATDPGDEGCVRFHYARPQDWSGQFLLRRYPVQQVSLAHDCHALLERTRDTDRLQLLRAPQAKRLRMLAALVERSRQAARGFFTFTLDPLLAADATRLGLKSRGGYLVVQDTGHRSALWAQLVRTPWEIQSGDRL
jgi:ribosomal protein S18 acetylase RimI-like enzyme